MRRPLVTSFAASLEAERDRWLLWLPVAFAGGIGFYFSLPFEPPFLAAPSVLLIAAAVLLASRRRFVSRWRTLSTVPAVLAVIVASGFTTASMRAYFVAAPVLERPVGPTHVTARVSRIETFPRGLRLLLDDPRITGVAAPATPHRVRLRLTAEQPDIWPGDWVRVRARLSPPPRPTAPGGYDFQRWAYFEGIGAVGFGLGRATVTAAAVEAGQMSPGLTIEHIRRTITARIIAAVNGEAAGVAAALITGERRAVSEEIMESLRRSGLAHLLAISGLHIGLVAMIVFVGLRFLLAGLPGLALRFPIKKAAALAAVFAAFFYALLAGATLPTQRAFIMVGFALIAVLIDRRGLSVRSVAWAAFLVLLIAPESLLGASFQMSFAAALALVAAYEAVSARNRYSQPDGSVRRWLGGRLLLYVGGVLLTTLVASAATGPYALFHFNRFADYGLAANLAAVPVTALWIMPWAVAAVALMPLGLETAALTPAVWGIDWVVTVARTVSSWPGAVTLAPAMPVWGLIAITLGGLWICLWRRRMRRLGSIGLVVGLASVGFAETPHIWIDGDARVFAIRGADGVLRVSNTTAARWVRQTWLRGAGLAEAVTLCTDSNLAAPGVPRCDGSGCVVAFGDLKIAITERESALSEDCWAADLVISFIPVRGTCPAPTVIDRFDLWRHGAHTVHVRATGPPRIKTVSSRQGIRPWATRRPPKRPSTGRSTDDQGPRDQGPRPERALSAGP